MKNILTNIIRKIALASLALPLFVPALASANGNAALTASSATAGAGLAVTVTISLDTLGAQVFGYQADLSYSTSYFSSASIAMAAGSPFTVDTGSNDPDVASGGNIHFTRFYTTAKNFSGPVATITLQSNGTTGTSPISFKGICASTASTANCSAVSDSSGSQVLGTLNNGSINITGATASSAGGSTSAAKPRGGTTSKAVAVATPVASVPTTTSTTKTSSKNEDSVVLHKIVLTILDQSGHPIKDTKIILDGISGKTDSKGSVTLRGIEAGTASGNVYYNDQVIPFNVKISQANATQVSSIKVSIKKPSSLATIALGIGVFIIAAAALFMVVKKNNPAKLKSQSKIKLPVIPPVAEPRTFSMPAKEISQPPKPVPAKQPEQSTQPVEQPSPVLEKPSEPTQRPKPDPAPKPENKVDSSEGSSHLHEKAMDPGTIVTPEQEDIK